MKTMAEIEKELFDVIDDIGDPWLKDHCRLEFNGLKNEYADIEDVLETAVDYAALIIDWCGVSE
jgi:hypothetical protein